MVEIIKKQCAQRHTAFALRFSFVKAGVPAVEVLFVCFVLCNSKCFAKALIVYDLTLTKEADSIADIGIIDQTENVIVRHPCFLLSCYVIIACFERFPMFLCL